MKVILCTDDENNGKICMCVRMWYVCMCMYVRMRVFVRTRRTEYSWRNTKLRVPNKKLLESKNSWGKVWIRNWHFRSWIFRIGNGISKWLKSRHIANKRGSLNHEKMILLSFYLQKKNICTVLQVWSRCLVIVTTK